MLSTMVIAFGMSADAFAASLGRGAALQGPRRAREIVRTGLIFGSVEALAPLIGWAVGFGASAALASVDHWVAFALLAIIGLRMAWIGFTRSAANEPTRMSAGLLTLTAAATSVDAMTAGFSLALVNADILVVAGAIGVATCLMSATGAAIGRFAGRLLGRIAEVAGGLMLVGVGTSILATHLGIWRGAAALF